MVLRVVAVAVLSVLLTGSAFAQQEGGLVVQNPLDEILVALTGTLADSGVPFTEEQVRAITLVMDDQRRATEELFGQALNFSAGPPQGARLDRALAGIAWMTEAFLASVDAVLTPEQGEAWRRARLDGTVPESARLSVEVSPQGAPDRGGAGSSRQIAQIRINNNRYTAESLGAGGGGGGGARRAGRQGAGRAGRRGRNEVITRGGVGDFHGNVNFTFQNHHLNARNAFADNKPEYMQRNLNAGFNGPVLSNRLTIRFTANQNEVEDPSRVL